MSHKASKHSDRSLLLSAASGGRAGSPWNSRDLELMRHRSQQLVVMPRWKWSHNQPQGSHKAGALGFISRYSWSTRVSIIFHLRLASIILDHFRLFGHQFIVATPGFWWGLCRYIGRMPNQPNILPYGRYLYDLVHDSCKNPQYV